MKTTFNLLLVLLFIQASSCQTKNNETMTPSTLNFDNDCSLYADKPQTGHYLQINNQNCHYKILVNDLLVYSYNDTRPAYSMRIRINSKILKSGEQNLTVEVTPLQGNTLSPNTDITIQLIKYADMRDKENWGGNTTLLEWELPTINNITELPYYQYDTIFKAEVPYELNTMNHAINLSEMDPDELLKQVVQQFTTLHGYIKNDYDKFNALVIQRSKCSSMPKYQTEEKLLKVLENNKNDFKDPEYKTSLQPLTNYKLRLYGNGRVATLERLSDGGRVIWCKDPETGEEILSLPLFIYKDKRDNQWHIW